MAFIRDYNFLCALGMSFSVGLVIAAWMVYTLKKRPRALDRSSEDVRQCPFCAQIFRHIGRQGVMRCPCCQSLLDEVSHEANA